MTDSQVARETLQNALAKDIGNKSHLLMDDDFFAITGNNSGTFLASVLEGIQAEIGELGGILVAKDSADAAFMPGFYR